LTLLSGKLPSENKKQNANYIEAAHDLLKEQSNDGEVTSVKRLAGEIVKIGDAVNFNFEKLVIEGNILNFNLNLGMATL